MKKGCLIIGVIVVVVLGIALLGGFFYYVNTKNTIVAMDELVKRTFNDLQAQYQRRSDLIPNLVEVVKGYASHERETLEAVISARAEATKVTVKAGDAASMAAYQKSQGDLSQALGRLMMVTERYPDLKANENFRDLQSQLEGTENRVKQGRQDYNEAVRVYNTYLRSFFVELFFGGKFPLHKGFEAEAGAEKAPKVKF